MAKDKKVDETKPVKVDETKPAKADKKAAKKKKSKKNPFKSIAAFFKSTNAERKKIVWPTAKETVKNTIIVLVVTLIVGLAIYGVDSLLTLGMKGVKSLADNTTVSAEADDTANTDADIVEDGTDEASSAESTSGTTEATSNNASQPAE
ncbi:MAG: preprotein translocase subunit SecE [Eubacterium sp.]|nr:preprotein translocase subunit SecE [Eubacterium sp.]